MAATDKQIFVHVGLGKVASTYLQYRVFPKLKGIHYIQRTKYKYFKKLIPATQADNILLSREFDNQLEREVQEFSKHFPQAHPIILLRRHDSWIASQYRRYAKNGWPLTFDEFIDARNDAGFWKLESLDFYKKIQILEECFENKPIVLFYDDLLADPGAFVKKLADYMGATYNPDDISFSRLHTSYNEHQMKVMNRFGRYVNITHWNYAENKVLRYLLKMGIYSIRYSVLYGSLLVPKSVVGTEPLIPKESLQAIAEITAKDWEKCRAYAREHNPF